MVKLMMMEPEPLCDGCYMRCQGCAYFYDDEDFVDDGGSPTALLKRDAKRRLELDMDLLPEHVEVLEDSGNDDDGQGDDDNAGQPRRSASPVMMISASPSGGRAELDARREPASRRAPRQ